jgi:hypothetical protein
MRSKPGPAGDFSAPASWRRGKIVMVHSRLTLFCYFHRRQAEFLGARDGMMDDESIGLLGVLLIMTVIVLSHPLQAKITLPLQGEGRWLDLAEVFACQQASPRDCRPAQTE